MAESVAIPGQEEASTRVLLALEAGRECAAIEQCLWNAGWIVERVEDPGQTLRALDPPQSWAAVVADVACGGRELLDSLRTVAARPEVILLASFGTVQDAVDAMRAGAFDYLTRPTSPEQVALTLARARERRRLQRENASLRESLDERFSLGELHSKDPRMRRIAEVVQAVADTRAGVLITGESGTGKTLLARTLHARSSRARKPFIVVDCGALPGSLLESTLFGHARGAFTGAARDKPGVFEAADGGTLFLDEIANAPLDLQAKLLRVVQERAFERVGETRTRQVDVRLIAASNRDLRAEIAAGRFREDLYWRLNVVALELPPLRERAGDIPLLAELLVRRFAREHGRAVHGFVPAALAALCAAPWPGNVRELEHAIERATLLCRGEVLTPQDLGLTGGAVDAAAPALPAGAQHALKRALQEPERLLIRGALETAHGSRTRAAALLGINRTTLFNKMRKYELLDFPARLDASLDIEPARPQPTAPRGRDA